MNNNNNIHVLQYIYIFFHLSGSSWNSDWLHMLQTWQTNYTYNLHSNYCEWENTQERLAPILKAADVLQRTNRWLLLSSIRSSQQQTTK